MHITSAQLSSTIDWPRANCQDRKQAFQELASQDNIFDLRWTYEGMMNDILDPRCAFLGTWQPVGYVNDPDLIIDPNMQEQMYYIPESNFFFVTYTAKNTIAFVFRAMNAPDPFTYLSMKEEPLMWSVNIGRALYAPPPPPPPPPPTPPPTPPPEQQEVSVSSEANEEVAVSSEEKTAASSSEDTNQEDLFRQIEEMGALSSATTSERQFYRDGKVVQKVSEDDQETGVVDTNEQSGIEDDPVMQQLKKEQEEYINVQESNAEGSEDLLEGEEIVTEENEQAEEEDPKPSAGTQGGGISMTTLISGGAAILLGIGFALFFLLKKKSGGKPPKEDAPPPAQAITEGPQQKSDRLEKALAAMDENESES